MEVFYISMFYVENFFTRSFRGPMKNLITKEKLLIIQCKENHLQVYEMFINAIFHNHLKFHKV